MLDVRKIRIVIALVITAIVATAAFTITKARQRRRSAANEEDSPPALQPAPENLMRRNRVLNMLKKNAGSFYVNEDGDIIINGADGKSYRVGKDGNITGILSSGEETADLSDGEKEFVKAALEEMESDFLPDDARLRQAMAGAAPRSGAGDEDAEGSAASAAPPPFGERTADESAAHGANASPAASRHDGESVIAGQSSLKSVGAIPSFGGNGANGLSPSPNQTQNAQPASQSDYIPLDTSLLADSFSRTDYSKQNSQDEKLKFLENISKGSTEWSMLTRNDIAPGTIVPITLITGINSDLPGEVIAQTNVNVYDTLTGTRLLIAKGTKLIATYDSKISYGQERIMIAWTTLVRSDGLVMSLPGFQGTDSMGRSGYSGKTDNHFSNIAGASLLSSLVDVSGLALSDLIGNNSADTVIETIADSVTSPAKEIIARSVNRQPTITIAPGAECRVLISKTLTLPEQKL